MKAVIALGANIGDPRANVDLAIALLREASDVQAVSSYYTTAPVGGPQQPDYVNAVCIVESELPALDLLSVMHGIEKTLGRQRNERWHRHRGTRKAGHHKSRSCLPHQWWGISSCALHNKASRP